jgi:hypothetical protein
MLLSELAGKHQGETVWVTGSGHSLSFIDPKFFDDKVTVAVNLSASTHGFTPTYLFSHYHQVIADNLDPLSVGVTLERDTLSNQSVEGPAKKCMFLPSHAIETCGHTLEPLQ